MRFALAQVNPTVGEIRGNAALVLETVAEARRAEADVVVFPELVLSGYPPEDLLLKDHFVRDCEAALAELAPAVHGLIAVVGTPFCEGDRVYNGAAVLADGRVAARYRKIRLPNYAVFDEERYFTPGNRILLLDLVGTAAAAARSGSPVTAAKALEASSTARPAARPGESAPHPSAGRGEDPGAATGQAAPRLGLNICEDIWFPCGPTEEAALVAGAQVIVNISMSPYHFGKGEDREEMLRQRALDAGAFILYVNGVGGQDELVFDGHTMVFAPDGELLVRGPQFEEVLLLLDIDPAGAGARQGSGSAPGVWLPEFVQLPLQPDGKPGRSEAARGGSALANAGSRGDGPADVPLTERPVTGIPVRPAQAGPPLEPLEEVYRALTLGVRDYVRKNGFRHVVLGMSGGIDSALTACIATDALGREAVTAVSMPSRYSSPGTRSDAREAAENLGVGFLELPIEQAFASYLDILSLPFAGTQPNEAEENLQARIRGNLLMALSNKFGWLVLTTGNKSEMAVGYATLYGDMAGGFAVIKDVPKTLVYELARYRNSLDPGDVGPIPETVLIRAPSAELRPDQTDQDSLPPYEILDRIVEAYVVRDESVEEICASGLPREVVERVVWLIDRNEYKRRQAPPGPRITSKAFGKDRRLPITSGYRG